MSFSKRYEEYRQERGKGMPWIDLHGETVDLILCDREEEEARNRNRRRAYRSENPRIRGCYPLELPHFNFLSCRRRARRPLILTEMSAVSVFFNKKSHKLLKSNCSSPLWRFIPRFEKKIGGNKESLVQEAKSLITYAIMNSMAMKKKMESFDTAAFKLKARRLQMDISRSPWLFELMALWINTSEKVAGDGRGADASGNLGECFLAVEDGKPVLSCSLFELPKLDVDLTCPVCLETVFDPVALSCGHIFCFVCCCSVARVSTVDGLDLAPRRTRCPFCRRVGVFGEARRLTQLSTLLKNRCPEYWKQRRRTESAERVQQAKEHWELQCRKFVGMI